MSSRTKFLAGLAAAALALAAAACALADTKIVAVVNVTGAPTRFGGGGAAGGNGGNGGGQGAQPPSPYPQTVTIYYKGADARLESGNTVLIFKGVEGNVYTISTARKEYFVKTYKDELNPFAGMGGGRFTNFQPQVTATLTQSTDASTAHVIGAITAQDNSITGQATMPSFGGRRGFGGGGGGGFGGGNGGNGGGGNGGAGGANAGDTGLTGTAPQARLVQDNATPPADNSTPATPPARVMKLTGDVWTSSSVALPDNPNATVMPSLLSLGRQFLMFMPSLVDSINKTKMIPLDIKLSYTRPSRNPDVTPTPIVGTITTKSISTDPLPDSLFTVPADYTKIDPPQPQFGGRRFGGGGGGDNGGGANGGAAAPPAAGGNAD